jgi:hypothetical protein
MWKLRRDNKVEVGDCAHNVTHSSASAGLERVICEVCHHVSIRYVEEVIADDIVLAEGLPMSETAR